MKHLLLAAALLVGVPAQAQTPIHFASGSDSGSWAGHVTRPGAVGAAAKTFALGMSKGQTLWVQSEDVYSCQVVAPSGWTTDCRMGHGTGPGSGVRLPETGNYKIETYYRMSGSAMDPGEPGRRRYVSVMFTVR